MVHQLQQQQHRADHHRRDRHQLHRYRHQPTRTGSPLGRTGRCGSPTGVNNIIGRITTAGVVTNYTGTGIDAPLGITAGPDGALWFTNVGNSSIGRITTTGIVTNYTGTGISGPDGITAGPDGALWFTNSGNNTIGRITTTGIVTNYTGTGISTPNGITAGPDGALWFTNEVNNSIGRITPIGATVLNVAFLGSSSAPQIVITGSGFGTAPRIRPLRRAAVPAASTTATTSTCKTRPKAGPPDRDLIPMLFA